MIIKQLLFHTFAKLFNIIFKKHKFIYFLKLRFGTMQFVK